MTDLHSVERARRARRDYIRETKAALRNGETVERRV
jgi:hypothetical protein